MTSEETQTEELLSKKQINEAVTKKLVRVGVLDKVPNLIPDYCGDVALAMGLIDYVPQHIFFVMGNTVIAKSPHWAVSFRWQEKSNEHKYVDVDASTPAEAIARAFLQLPENAKETV